MFDSLLFYQILLTWIRYALLHVIYLYIKSILYLIVLINEKIKRNNEKLSGLINFETFDEKQQYNILSKNKYNRKMSQQIVSFVA